MLPKVMDSLMPHMIGDVIPLVSDSLIAHLRGSRRQPRTDLQRFHNGAGGAGGAAPLARRRVSRDRCT